MAIFSLNIRPIGKTTHKPNTAAAHIRYITRKKAVSKVMSGRMPDRPGPAQSWINREEIEDRKNARIADRIMVAFPKELHHEQRAELARDFAEKLTEGRASWMAAIHDKGKDVDNPHCHILVRDRDVETGKRVIMMSEKNSAHKVRDLWEKTANLHLERAGIEERIDRRSLKEQGIEREPQIHEGVKSKALQEKGEKPLSRTREKGGRKVKYRKIDRGKTRGERNEQIKEINEALEADVEMSIDDKVSKLLVANDRVKMYQRHEQKARLAGDILSKRNRAYRKSEWMIDRATEDVAYHEDHLEELLKAYRNPKEAKRRLEKLAKDANLDTFSHQKKQRWKVIIDRVTGRGRFALGQKRAFAMLKGHHKSKADGIVRTAAQVDRAIVYRYMKIREAEAGREVKRHERMMARSHAESAKGDYKRAKDVLGDHKTRAEAKRRLYGARNSALRDIDSADIWNSELPYEDKQELAKVWEKQAVKEAELSAERERYARRATPDEKSKHRATIDKAEKEEEGKSFEALLLTAKERRQQRHDRLRDKARKAEREKDGQDRSR